MYRQHFGLHHAPAFFKVVVAFLCSDLGLWNGHILSFWIEHDSAHRRPVAGLP